MKIRTLNISVIGLVFCLLLCFNNVNASPVYFSGTGHWYEAISVQSRITWTNANITASGLGGYLATIKSEGEDQFVYNLAYSTDYWFQGADMYWYGPWLGGTRMADNSWGWITGESFTYTNWNTGEPNNATYPVVEDSIHYFNGFGWNDNADNYPKKGYIVEYNSNPVPEPTTMLLLGLGLMGLAGIRGIMRK